MSVFFSNHKEFELLKALIPASRMGTHGQAIGDDGFLLPVGKNAQGDTLFWAISTDGSLEGKHYSLTWSSVGRALEKAVLSNLSDINAMGGTCSHLFFHLGSSPHWGKAEFQEMGQRLEELEQQYGFQLSGGDLTPTNLPQAPSHTPRKNSKTMSIKTPGNSFFSFTAMGAVEGKPLLRSNAKPGHKVYVTGALGGSAAGLALLQQQKKDRKNLWKKTLLTSGQKEVWDSHWKAQHFIPTPPLKLGPLLSTWSQEKSKPISAIDISDGLSSELNHIAHQSNVCIRIHQEFIPVAKGLNTCFLQKQVQNWALHGGEGYQLLFTGIFTKKQLQEMRHICEVTEIGFVEKAENTQGTVWLERKGKPTRLKAKGWGS
jgi:thiamine-monophosphate kinase